MRLITKWLPVAVKDGANIDARGKLADAQFLAGMSFNSAGLGAVHALAHQPGATHNLPHGVCNAILLPVISEFNAKTNPEPYRAVAEAMGGDTRLLNDMDAAMLAIELIRKLSSEVGIPAGFSNLGIKESDCHAWIDKALADVCMGGNPRQLSPDDVSLLYLTAM